MVGSCVAVTFEDKKGNAFAVKDCAGGDIQELMEMYLRFSPKPASQGLPPLAENVCRKWVEGLLETGINLLAVRDGKVIGHVALIPEVEQNRAEYLIFVDRSARNRGVGKALTQMVLNEARERGIRDIWLSVETYNFRAINLYKRFDFAFCDMNECERTMTCRL